MVFTICYNTIILLPFRKTAIAIATLNDFHTNTENFSAQSVFLSTIDSDKFPVIVSILSKILLNIFLYQEI
ncbi:MAG: hypothetical protein SAL07_12940 [Oscillatoria sp. PMC 1051.18]|nr:hypothetical protein [Oscillatoria sp. PMC 1050.18]MEC5030797.1 hypothetical protein [Oscillatoria sp. PMC 1051.18]